MKRRDFIGLAGSVTASPLVWSLAIRAQTPAIPTIGFLSSGSAPSFAQNVAAFMKGLNDRGYFDGRNIAVEYRWAEGRYGQLPQLAKELVDLKVAILVASGGTTAVRAAKAATSALPVLFAMADDPVAGGYVTSLNHPGGNLTGVAFMSTELVPKRLGVLRELVPHMQTVAVLVNPDSPESETILRDTAAAVKSIGIRLVVLKAGANHELGEAFATLAQERADALIVGTDPLYRDWRDEIVALAARNTIPTVYFLRDFVAAGGLISYGTSFTEPYRPLGVYAARILKGEKPADLPVLLSSTFDLAINLKTAKALGLTVPPGLIAIADEVIE